MQSHGAMEPVCPYSSGRSDNVFSHLKQLLILVGFYFEIDKNKNTHSESALSHTKWARDR